MQIVSHRDTLHEMSNPFLCVVCVCGGGGWCVGGGLGRVFDPLTFTTLSGLIPQTISSLIRLTIGLPELSFTKYEGGSKNT